MIKVVTSIDILCPIDKVYRFASNPDNAPLWYENIKWAVWKTPKPLSIGSKIDFVAHFLGKELKYTYKVMEMSPTKFVMLTAQGPFTMQTTYLWESLSSNKTSMTLINEGEPTGFSRLFSPFMSMMMRRANKKDLKKIKELLENEN